MAAKIKSVEKGFGEGSVFFSTNPNVSAEYFVDEICVSEIHYDSEIYMRRFSGYVNGELRFEMNECRNTTVIYQ